MAVENNFIYYFRSTIKAYTPEQVEVPLCWVVDTLVHHSACQRITILVFVVVQGEEPGWKQIKLYNQHE